MKIKKLSALLVSAVLCAGMAAPAFAFEGEATPVEQPILPEVVEDVVTVTDETSGALTPDTGGRLPHQLFGWFRAAVHHAGIEIGCDILSGNRSEQ